MVNCCPARLEDVSLTHWPVEVRWRIKADHENRSILTLPVESVSVSNFSGMRACLSQTGGTGLRCSTHTAPTYNCREVACHVRQTDAGPMACRRAISQDN